MSLLPPDHDLLFAFDFPPMDGGIARWMAALATGYPAGELTVSTGSLAGSAASDPRFSQRIDRIDVPAGRLRTLPGVLAWSRRGVALARQGARFAWCDTIRPAGYPAHWAFRRTGLPYGIMLVGNDILTLRAKLAKNGYKRRLQRAILGDAAVFVAISEWTASRARELFDDARLDAAARLRVVPLGTDARRFRPDPAAAEQLRRDRGLPAGRWLVTVARLVEYKGIDTVIELLARLAPDFPNLHYAVVGRGPHEAELRALAERHGVSGRVHLLTDIDDSQLAAAYSLGEIYVGLTRETALDVEGFGISFAEAAACGLPVVAARSGGIPDAVVDGETGILVAPDDGDAAVRAVRQLLDQQETARRLGAAGRLRVERHLNWERVVRDMRAIAAEHQRSNG
jgi:phosphatidyl-myo-inositol dimannoside synthase